MKKYELLICIMAVVMLIASSCKDSEDVKSGDDYYYYLDIQTEVRLHLSDAADEDESGTVSPVVDRLSRTIYHMQKAVREYDEQQGNRNKVATLLTTCDSLYLSYADMNPENQGKVVCYVKLLRCPLNPNGTANLKDAITLKYYIFWREASGIGGDSNP